jgi:hypothetical protein
MTGKRKSNDNVRQARRSEADLGQKATKLEKASERAKRNSGIWEAVMRPHPHGGKGGPL